MRGSLKCAADCGALIHFKFDRTPNASPPNRPLYALYSAFVAVFASRDSGYRSKFPRKNCRMQTSTKTKKNKKNNKINESSSSATYIIHTSTQASATQQHATTGGQHRVVCRVPTCVWCECVCVSSPPGRCVGDCGSLPNSSFFSVFFQTRSADSPRRKILRSRPRVRQQHTIHTHTSNTLDQHTYIHTRAPSVSARIVSVAPSPCSSGEPVCFFSFLFFSFFSFSLRRGRAKTPCCMQRQQQ